MVEHFVSFSSHQVIVRTDDERVSIFIRQTYEHMLTGSANDVVGDVSVHEERGVFEVRRSGKPGLSADDPRALFPQIVDDVLQEFMEARPDLLWLHAGVAERAGAGIVIPASSGSGKSTVTTALVERGWRFMSDDIAPIAIDELRVLSYPQLAHRRKFPGQHIADDRIGGLEREAVAMAQQSVHSGDAALEAIIFPEFGACDKPRFSTVSRGDAAMKLIQNVRNFSDHREAAIEAIAAIVRGAELYQFYYGNPEHMRVLFGHRKEFGFFLANLSAADNL
jgi:hypothetical protein